ncbi:hypothetical protein B0T09DRAFT_400640 [Sordaria sp. MPI-SDFR-AT-0083]|nr:hypothetical protein B0T09DRAFT_400640 [Sordaria sp. MPI-SDFR-AT-0083]
MKPSDFMTKALGLRPIHEAVLEGDLKKVKKIIHQDKKNVVNNQTTRDKVTPLHLAVLTGSLTTVKLLLLSKASFSIWAPIFREPEALRSILSTNDHPLSGSTILTDGRRLTILRKVVTTNLAFPVQNSTCGFIASYASTLPQMMAVSGWKDEREESSMQGVLPNAKMTALVRYACQIMEFKLYMQPYDCPGESVVPPEHIGRYMASHVEKQLSTTWVLKLLQDFLKTSDLVRMAELKHIELPSERSKAKVFLNHSPCGSCLSYLAKIRRVTGITFAVETIPFAVPGNRTCSDYSNPPPIQPGAKEDPLVAEWDNDYEELDRQQEVDENGPMVDFESLVDGEDNEVSDNLPVAQVDMQEVTTPTALKPTTDPTYRQTGIVAVRHRQGLQGTSSPSVRNRLGLNKEEFDQFLEAQSPRRLLGSGSLLDPISTINGRSAFFQTPVAVSAPLQGAGARNPERLEQSVQPSSSPPPRLEICLPQLISSNRSQYAMAPDDEPASPINESRKQLNLKRFSYRKNSRHQHVYPRLSDANPRLSRSPASSHLLQRLKLGQSKGLAGKRTSNMPGASNEDTAQQN